MPRNPWPALIVICLGFFMIMLDTTIVIVATPSILTGLHASLDQLLWVFNGYLLAYAVLLITAGRLGDLFGPRQLFIVGLVLFTLASAACGLAQDSTQLIAARVVQGVGGALLAPQTLAILMAIFPAERRGAALGVWSGIVGVSTLAGPTLGGLIITNLDWRWIFYLNLPIGVIALIGSLVLVPDVRQGRRPRFDLIGVALLSAALFLVVFGLIEGQRYDWGMITGWLTIPMVMGAGLLLFAIFLLFESRQTEPLVPLGLFRIRNFSLMNGSGTAMGIAMQGVFVPFSIYSQSVLGMTALKSGLTVAPLSAVSMVVAPVAGRLTDRLGGKYLLMAGLAIFAGASAWWAAVASTTSGSATFILPFALGGLGLGLVFAPMTTIAMRDIAPRMAGAASGILNTTRQLGQVVGAAGIGAVLQSQLATAMRDRATVDSVQLPQPARAPFVDGFAQAARAGLQVGRGQTGGVKVPRNLPSQLVAQIQALAHDVFTNAFVTALRPTVALAVAVLLVASISCVFVAGRRRQPAAKAQAIEPAIA